MIEKANAIKKYTKQHSSFTYGFKNFRAHCGLSLSLSLSLSLNGKFDLGTGEAERGKFFFSAFISIKLCLLLSISNVSINERRE